MRFLVNTIIFAALSLVIVPSTSAQISLSDLPAWEGNDRFYNDVISEVKHPSLTLNGFDSGAPGGGFSLKQVLEEVYSSSADSSVKIVYSKIIGLAANNADFHPSPSSRSDIIENTRRMQARAFMALVTYVMKRNGEGDELESLPDNIETPDKAADRLRSALTNTDAWRIVKSWKKDGVKWSSVLENMARTMDLYLALENAYCYYGDQGHTPSQQECSGATTDRLLSQTEKGNVFAHFGEQIKTLEKSPNWKIPDEIGTSRYHTDPGNWPLKVQTAIGYASLTHQTVNPVTGVPPSVVQDHVDRALKANFAQAGDNRDLKHYWGYQTDDGKRFWAEGPFYLRFALRDVLPFWHAIRINGMLDYHPDFNAPDPFHDSQFTNPLHWLADLTTPGGKTPPLDDGNKRAMKVSMLLRWSSGYGKAALGQKFAWIADKHGFGAVNDLLPVEIAIPRLEGSGTPPASQVGGNQQVIARHSSGGQDHYVLLNGESGAANVRGEGHEQPDQLQLLYYVNGTSFLMDSGYDSGGFGISEWINPEEDVVSTWNRYYDHNVMVGIHTTDKGLPWPDFDLEDMHIESKSSGVKSLWANENGNVTILNGKQRLSHAVVKEDGSKWGSTYKRYVLFIGGDTPYLIDFSRMRHNVSRPLMGDRQFAIRYHVKSNTVDLNNFDPQNGQFIKWSDVDGSGNNLYLYPLHLEFKANAEQNDIVKTSDDALETKTGDGTTNIQRVDIKDYEVIAGGDRHYFPLATIIQARNQTPPYGPKLLNNYGKNHQGWVWKHDSEIYDVFIARNTKSGNGSAVHTNLQDANSQYPSFCVKLPSGKRYGFARVHKNGGEWSIDPDYQVNLDRPPVQVFLSGPFQLGSGEQGTWTAFVNGCSGSITYDWKSSPPWTNNWQDEYCTGSSCTLTFVNSCEVTQSAGIRVISTRGAQTDTASATVDIAPHELSPTSGSGPGPNLPSCSAPSSTARAPGGGGPAVRDLRAEEKGGGTVRLSWQAPGSGLSSEFVVEHRPDSTGAWSQVGTVPAGDSSSVDSSRAVTYRYRTDKLEIGPHQFRVGLPEEAGSGPRAVSTSDADNARRYTGPVTAEIAMEEAYRLRAYPNPVQQRATVELAVRERQDVQVRLYDVLGRRVGTLHDGPLPAQELRRLRLDVSATGLVSGTYFLRVTGKNFAATEQITVVQ